MNEDIKNVSYEEAVKWARDYMRQKNISQAELSRKLSISSAAVSSYLNGKYPNPETVTEKIAELMDMQAQKTLAPRAPEYVETTVTKMVKQAISYAHLRGVVSVAYGDAGVGKTTAVQQYLKENQLAIGIEIIPTYASLTGVNELLADELGSRERTDRKITKDIISKLKGSGRVIIVDEAQHLTVRAIEHLRSISDSTGIGICFVGNESIYTKLLGTHKSEYAQLFSRIGVRKMVTTSTNTRDDMDRIFGQYVMDEESMKILHQISRTNYGLRGAVNAYINTIGVFDEINPSNLNKVIRDMGIAG